MMIPKKLISEIKRKENKTFLISAHIHLEADALGSELALAGLLRKLGKKVIIVNEDVPGEEYNFLPGVSEIQSKIERVEYDAAIITDCSDLSRIGKVAKIIDKKKTILNIDHHISNTRFADVNWVQPLASSASEMIFDLFKALKVKISKNDAINLYSGILTDTGSFKYSSTTSATHEVASQLLKCGIDVYDIHRRLNESLSFQTIKSFEKVIRTLEISKDGKVAWIQVSNFLMKKTPALKFETDGLIQFARSIKGVEVSLLFKEIKRNSEVRVNFRSRGKVDVNSLASVFGGGGHKTASGATIRGSIKDAVLMVLNETEKRLK